MCDPLRNWLVEIIRDERVAGPPAAGAASAARSGDDLRGMGTEDGEEPTISFPGRPENRPGRTYGLYPDRKATSRENRRGGQRNVRPGSPTPPFTALRAPGKSSRSLLWPTSDQKDDRAGKPTA